MQNILNENLLSLSQAASRIPPYRGTRTNPSTVFRWITTGVRLADGNVVRLEALRIANRWLTSVEALQRFAQTCSETHMQVAQTPAMQSRRTPRQRESASRVAAQRLRDHGI